MCKQIGNYLIFITTFIFSKDLPGQDLQDSLYNAIPIEAYEGFKHDTFTLSGESKPRQIVKVGVHKSHIKIHLQEVGEVYVHHVLAFLEDGYPYMEIYSREPSSGFIQGIKRYGHYRMYYRQSFEAEDRYNGNSRIEFVNGLNTIVKSINPRKVFSISAGREMSWAGDMGDDATTVSFVVKDCRKYVDTVLYDSTRFDQSNPGCSFSGWIQYVLEGGLLMVDLHAGIGSEEPAVLYTFESVIYDTLGQMVGRVSESVPVNYFNLTANHEYVYINGGGALTEDFEAPYTFKIKKLKTGEVLFERKSTSDYIAGFVVEGTNLGVYEVERPFQSPPVLEAYVIDLDKNLIYPIHHNALCQPPLFILFFKDYCECRTPNGLKTKLYYARDFTTATFIKK